MTASTSAPQSAPEGAKHHSTASTTTHVLAGQLGGVPILFSEFPGGAGVGLSEAQATAIAAVLADVAAAGEIVEMVEGAGWIGIDRVCFGPELASLLEPLAQLGLIDVDGDIVSEARPAAASSSATGTTGATTTGGARS